MSPRKRDRIYSREDSDYIAHVVTYTDTSGNALSLPSEIPVKVYNPYAALDDYVSSLCDDFQFYKFSRVRATLIDRLVNSADHSTGQWRVEARQRAKPHLSATLRTRCHFLSPRRRDGR